MNFGDNGVLKLKTMRLVLKDDLNYKMTEEEKALYAEMNEEEKKIVRRNLLMNIRNKILSLDVLEEFLEQLKNEEYQRYMMNEGKNCDVETQMEQVEAFENNYSRMVINIACEKSNEEDLLGPSIHETYGIKEENESLHL